MRKTLLLIVLSLTILNLAHTQADGFDKSYQPKTPSDGTKVSADQPKLSYNNIDSPLVDIVWCGVNGTTLFILSE